MLHPTERYLNSRLTTVNLGSGFAPTRYREVVLTVSKLVSCWAQSEPPRGSGWVQAQRASFIYFSR